MLLKNCFIDVFLCSFSCSRCSMGKPSGARPCDCILYSIGSSLPAEYILFDALNKLDYYMKKNSFIELENIMVEQLRSSER